MVTDLAKQVCAQFDMAFRLNYSLLPRPHRRGVMRG